MCDIRIEGRTHSIIGIHDECYCSKETQKVDACIKDTWILSEYVNAMKNNGNLTAETLSEFFWFAAETIDDIGNAFDDVDIDEINWEQLAAFYRGE